MATVHPGQPPQKLTPQLRAKVLERTRQEPPDGPTHWSLRKMAENLIARIWKEADLKPHRLERYAAVFCVDEKNAIQALDGLDRRLPLSPGRAERHG